MNRLRGVPTPEFTRKFLVDGTLVWIFIRIALPLIVAVFGGDMGGSVAPAGLSLGLPASTTLVALCGALIVLDVLRRRESVLLANLGTSLRAVFVTGAIPAAVAESATSLIAAATGL